MPIVQTDSITWHFPLTPPPISNNHARGNEAESSKIWLFSFSKTNCTIICSKWFLLSFKWYNSIPLSCFLPFPYLNPTCIFTIIPCDSLNVTYYAHFQFCSFTGELIIHSSKKVPEAHPPPPVQPLTETQARAQVFIRGLLQSLLFLLIGWTQTLTEGQHSLWLWAPPHPLTGVWILKANCKTKQLGKAVHVGAWIWDRTSITSARTKITNRTVW